MGESCAMIRSCKRVTELISESNERKLPLWKRMLLWFHLSMCRLCRGFARDSREVRRSVRRYGDSKPEESQETLSDETRERIKELLRGDS